MPQLTEAQREQVCAEYLSGKSTKEVARQFGVHFSAVSYILKRYGHSARTIKEAMHKVRKLDADDETTLCSRYSAGESAKELAREFGINHCTARNILKRHGVPRTDRKRLKESELAEMCRRYESGEDTPSLSRAFGVTRTNVLVAVRRRGGEVRSAGEVRTQYMHNADFFKSIDSERKAYWLGFLAADGCVYAKPGRSKLLTITLASKDREHLYQLRDDLQSDHPIKEISNNGYGAYRIDIASGQLVNDLVRHGITPRKSGTLQWPDFLSRDLLPHYLRGYFDGDGCASTIKGYLGFSIVGNIAFIGAARTYLVEALGLRRNKLIPLHGSEGFASLRYSGRPAVRVYGLMHDGATVFLPRKHQKAFESVTVSASLFKD